MTSVSAKNNLFDYFNEQVAEARHELSVTLSGDTSLYLASLMAGRVRTDRPAPVETTLAELHASAANARPADQARTYRELGDRSLYQLGYFRQSLERTPVTPSYYEDMGSAAYHQVDQVFKRWFSDAFGPVFFELAEHFGECVGILTRIRDKECKTPDELGRLYEEWIQTGDSTIASKLKARGLLLPRWPGSA